MLTQIIRLFHYCETNVDLKRETITKMDKYLFYFKKIAVYNLSQCESIERTRISDDNGIRNNLNFHLLLDTKSKILTLRIDNKEQQLQLTDELIQDSHQFYAPLEQSIKESPFQIQEKNLRNLDQSKEINTKSFWTMITLMIISGVLYKLYLNEVVHENVLFIFFFILLFLYQTISFIMTFKAIPNVRKTNLDTEGSYYIVNRLKTKKKLLEFKNSLLILTLVTFLLFNILIYSGIHYLDRNTAIMLSGILIIGLFPFFMLFYYFIDKLDDSGKKLGDEGEIEELTAKIGILATINVVIAIFIIGLFVFPLIPLSAY